MSANTFGKLFTITSAGESHGPALVAIVDGCPPRLELTETDIQVELDRRRPGQSKVTTQRQEKDRVEILSGVFEGKTTGAPIALLIRNEDARERDYAELREVFRPGHADYTYFKKYGIRDHRGGGRSSARETAMRVAAGAIAKKVLREHHGVVIKAYIKAIGAITAEQIDFAEIDKNDFYFPDSKQLSELEALITELRRAGDGIGARLDAVVTGVPVGWGEPVFAKLNAQIAAALMGINAAKAVEIGDGFAVVEQRSSVHRDEMTQEGFITNHSGGILGGISSGQDLRVSVAFKPPSSIRLPGRSLTTQGAETEVITIGRHDVCVGIRAVPIVEAMLALVLLDNALIFKARV